jgi:hypothetical protein
LLKAQTANKRQQQCLKYVRSRVSAQWLEITYLTRRTEHVVALSQTCTHIVFGLSLKKDSLNCAYLQKGMRIIDKNGIENVLASLRANGEKI